MIHSRVNWPCRAMHALVWPVLVVGLAGVAGCYVRYKSTTVAEVAESDKPSDTGGIKMEDSGPQIVRSQDDDSPLRVTLRLAKSRAAAGDTIDLSVRLQIAPFWEIHALDAEAGSVATTLELELPDGVTAAGQWQAPEPATSLMPDGHPAYSGEVVFTRAITVTDVAATGEHAIRCRVRYQACNEQQCLSPATVELVGRLTVE